MDTWFWYAADWGQQGRTQVDFMTITTAQFHQASSHSSVTATASLSEIHQQSVHRVSCSDNISSATSSSVNFWTITWGVFFSCEITESKKPTSSKVTSLFDQMLQFHCYILQNMNHLVHTSTACNRLHDLSDSMRRDTRLWPSHNLCTALKLKYKKFKINKWNIRTKKIYISLVSTLLWDRAALDSHMLPLVAQTKSCHLHSREIVLRRQRWRVKFHAGRGKGYAHLPCAWIGLIDITINMPMPQVESVPQTTNSTGNGVSVINTAISKEQH